MQIKQNDEKLIDLKNLCELLKIKGISSAKKWCEKSRIKVLTIGNKSVVHKFLVDIELDKYLIRDLKNEYPTKWIELYKCYKENDHLGYISLLEDSVGRDTNTIISKRVKPMSDRAKKLLNS